MRITGKPNIGMLRRKKWLPVFFIVFILLFLCFGKAMAQRGNQSDWIVPPPLLPGTTTKGDTEGRPGTSGVAMLTLTDVPAPFITPALLSGIELAPIGNTAPDVSHPEQPLSESIIAALPDVPLPGVPETPAMPNRTVADTPEPPAPTLPLPNIPEMPPSPQRPVSSTNGTTLNTGSLPLIPGIPLEGMFSAPPADQIMWNTPGILPSIDFKLTTN